MFNSVKLPASPGLARRLVKMSNFNNMAVNEELISLSEQGVLNVDDLHGKWSLDSQQLKALQHVIDWRGRAMLLESGNDRSREVALSHVYLRGGKTLILASPSDYDAWATLIREAWPDKAIGVFGNPRHTPKTPISVPGVKFSDTPDLEADFVITSYSGVIWHDLVSKATFNQTIVEELSKQNSFNYKWADAINGIFHEIPSPLFLQSIHDLPPEPNKDILASLQDTNSKAIQYLGQQVYSLMWVNLPTAKPLASFSLKDVIEYMSARNYSGIDNLKLLSLYGVNSDLLEGENGKSALTFFNNTVSAYRASRKKNPESGLARFIDREMDLKRHTNQKMTTMVQSALSGDTVAQKLIGGLMTLQWANLKGQHIKEIHRSIANRMSRCLFLVDNPDMKRSLRIQFGNMIDDLVISPDPVLTRVCFHYPQQSPGEVLVGDQWKKVKSVPNLMVTIDDLIDHPSLLSHASFLFLTDWPLDREIYDTILAACNATGTRMIRSVLNGTFEEKFSQLIR